MDTQNTPVHAKLWHTAFWKLAFACFFLTAAVYTQFVSLPSMLLSLNFSPSLVALIFGSYGVGLYLLGAKCSYLIQTYRRNNVCIRSVLGVVVILGAIGLLSKENHYLTSWTYIWGRVVLNLLLGAFYGLSQMILTSTLVIDVCESFRRTEANYVSGWFSRFALPLGPLLAIFMLHISGFQVNYWGAMGLAFIALCLILLVQFPFKSPEDDVPHYSLDRFFLPQSIILFCNQILILVVVGMLLVNNFNIRFYSLMLVGLSLAIISERFVFVNADLKSEIITGHFAIIIALLLMILKQKDVVIDMIEPALIGLGVGIIGARFQLFFIKLSKHCQRGTSQSTFFLGWETGLLLGVALGYLFFYDNPLLISIIALSISFFSLLIYHFYTHKWYLENKNR
nr:MFS transporter [uncultured Prevotella sp.]